ncbi:MAG: hypothetical protein L0I76_28680 [Pseudonocardia sp.]|nr:hypothetical protein [Pseudonocardia sp.]
MDTRFSDRPGGIPAQPGPAPAILATGTAVLTWTHQRGVQAHALVRTRMIAATDDDGRPATATAVVISQLRSSPRGGQIGSDFPGIAEVAARLLLPAGHQQQNLSWFAHHGPFSSYDDTGPETLTRVTLHHDDHSYRDHPADHQLLDPALTRAFLRMLQLEPVPDLLRAWPWTALDRHPDAAAHP